MPKTSESASALSPRSTPENRGKKARTRLIGRESNAESMSGCLSLWHVTCPHGMDGASFYGREVMATGGEPLEPGAETFVNCLVRGCCKHVATAR